MQGRRLQAWVSIHQERWRAWQDGAETVACAVDDVDGMVYGEMCSWIWASLESAER